MLTKEQILAYRPKPTKIEVPELGEVFVRLFTEAEALELSKLAGKEEARGRIVAKLLCDADGNRFFNDDELDEVLKIPFRATESIFDQGTKLNYPEMKEDAEKN